MKITKKYIQRLIQEELVREWDETDPVMGIQKAQAGLEEVRSRLEGMAMGQKISPERVLGMVDEVALRLNLALQAVQGGKSPMMEKAPVVQEYMPRPGEVPAEGERMEPTPSMQEVGKALEEAANVLIAGKVLAALHHGGAKEGSPLYERANTVLNELLNLRDDLEGLK